ncbi:VOC family protein [Streptomyces boninensis]|uniref:VOC family protein n=1 Tax=Streptomyces boninensis TaxID=2039455 RepID=UPI003B226573
MLQTLYWLMTPWWPRARGTEGAVLREGVYDRRGVRRLQRLLASRYNQPLTPDGRFGPATRRALRAAQAWEREARGRELVPGGGREGLSHPPLTVVSMAALKQISLGVEDDARAAAFWSRALGYVRRPPRFDGDDWIVLQPPQGGPGSAIALDVSTSPPPDLPRIHFDLHAGDRPLDEEVDRLLSLGARRVDWPHYPQSPPPGADPYVVLSDPEGNIFCVEGRRG